MKKVHPLNVKDLSQSVRQAQFRASCKIKSIGSFQIDRPKLRLKPSDSVGPIVIYDEYPVNSITNDNDEEDNNIHRREQASKGRTVISEDENIPSRHQNSAENEDNTNLALTLEKTHHEEIATLRANRFRVVLSNECDLKFFQWAKCVSYILVAITISATMLFLITMISINNPIQYPEYWYESLFLMTPCTVLLCLYLTMFFAAYLNVDYIKGTLCVLMVLFVGIVVMYLTFLSAYFFWTTVANFQFPVPFLGMIISYLVILTLLGTFWFLFPFEWRNNNEFRTRLKFVIGMIIHALTISFQFNRIYAGLLLKHQNEYQPIIAVFFRAILELNLWIGKKFLSRTTNGDKVGAELVLSIDVGIRYAMIICFSIGNITTFNTQILLMGIDFGYNVYLSLRIVWMNKRRPDDIDKQIELLQELTILELIQFTTPLVFILSIVSGFYGPNSELLVNIGATIWHSTPIKNIDETTTAILTFFLVDFCSTIVAAIILWKSCKINLFRAFVALMNEYGPIFCMSITFITYLVSTILCILN